MTKARLLATTKMRKLEQNHQNVTDQSYSGIFELIPDQLRGNQVHYISHHGVLKENA